MSCPWGAIQQTESFERGISFVSTAGHGGLRISKGYAHNHLSRLAISCATYTDENYLWYEEDCDYAIPLYELDYLWGIVFKRDKRNTTYAQRKASLESTIKYWNTKYAMDKGIPMQDNEQFCCKNWSINHDGKLDLSTMSCSVCGWKVK